MFTSVLVVSASMGAGHDGAARELSKRLEAKGVRTRTVDFLDAAPWTGRIIKAVYEFQLARAPWAYEATYRVWFVGAVLCAPLAFILGAIFGRRILRWAAECGASTVVSTYPLASVVLGRLRTRHWRRLDVPAITFVTDFAVHPLWVHRGIDLNLCVHPDSAAQAAAATGRPATAPGPLVAEAFRSGLPQRADARLELGLPAEARVVLVVAGSWGVGELEQTFDALAACGDWFPVAVCGQNAKLRERLETRGAGMVLGWTDAMPTLMAASDVLLQNAGGLTCMEAFAVGLPVVTYRPIPGHGRQNAIDMDRSGVAVFATDVEDLSAALDRATDGSGQLARLGKEMFCGDAAGDVRDIAVASEAIPFPVTHGMPRRLAVAGMTSVALYAGLNVVGAAANAAGLDAAQPPPHSKAVYPFVRLGAAALADPNIPKLLASDHFGAVIDGSLAAEYPEAVRDLANDGVTVANGGNTLPADLHLLSVHDNVTSAAKLISTDTGAPCRLYAPGTLVNGSDLIFASASHERILRSTNLEVGASGAQLHPGHIYLIEGQEASGPALEAWLRSLHTSMVRAGISASSNVTLLA